MVVSPRSALSSWTTPRVLSSVTSRAQVCDAIDFRFEIFVGSRVRDGIDIFPTEIRHPSKLVANIRVRILSE